MMHSLCRLRRSGRPASFSVADALRCVPSTRRDGQEEEGDCNGSICTCIEADCGDSLWQRRIRLHGDFAAYLWAAQYEGQTDAGLDSTCSICVHLAKHAADDDHPDMDEGTITVMMGMVACGRAE